MEIIRFKYDLGGDVMTIDLLVTGYENTHGWPEGYQVWETREQVGYWRVDDEPTRIIHPILYRQRMGTVRTVQA